MKALSGKVVAGTVVLAALLLCGSVGFAQDKDPRVTAPKSPLPPIGADESSSKNPLGKAAPEAAPQQTSVPLTSVRDWAPGRFGSGQNLLTGSFNAFFGADSYGANGSSGLNELVTVGGNIGIQRTWRSSTGEVRYSGGGTFYPQSSLGNRSNHDLHLSFDKSLRRWGFLVANNTDYSPEGRLGSGYVNGYGGGAYGSGGSGFNGMALPGQQIVSVNSPRVTNTALGEVRYSFSSRAGATFGGSYGLTRFVDNGLINSDMIAFRAGYNHSLSSRNWLALNYNGRLFRYTNIPDRSLNHMVQMVYGRMLTGRLTFQIGAGPQFSRRDAGTGVPVTHRISWAMQSSLIYKMETSSLRFSYFHAETDGSGYFLGSNTDGVNISYSRPITRMWQLGANGAYSRNEALGNSLLTNTTVGSRFNGWGGGLSLTRPIQRTMGVYFRYSAFRQTSENIACTGPTCALIGTRHSFGVGFTFSPNPIELD